jgi:hypothetical protein
MSVIAANEDFTLGDLYGHLTAYEARTGGRSSGGHHDAPFQHSANNTSRSGRRGGFQPFQRGGGGRSRGDGGRGNDGGRYGGYNGGDYGGGGYYGGRGGYYGRGHYDHAGRWIAGALVAGAVVGLVANASQPRTVVYDNGPAYYSRPATVVYQDAPVVTRRVTTTTYVDDGYSTTRYVRDDGY